MMTAVWWFTYVSTGPGGGDIEGFNPHPLHSTDNYHQIVQKYFELDGKKFQKLLFLTPPPSSVLTYGELSNVKYFCTF